MPTPEELARDAIDRLLAAAGWAVQDYKAAQLGAARGVARREFELNAGHGTADYLLYVEKDRPVLAAAIQLRCDALVTGDRMHFGAGYGRSFGGVTVNSPRSLAERLFA